MKLIKCLPFVALFACAKDPNTQQSNVASVEVSRLATLGGVDFSSGKLTFSAQGSADFESVTFKKMEIVKNLEFAAGRYVFDLDYFKDGDVILSSTFCSKDLRALNTQELVNGPNTINVHVCKRSGQSVDVVSGSIAPVIHNGEALASLVDFTNRADFSMECKMDQLSILISRTNHKLSLGEFMSSWMAAEASNLVYKPEEHAIEYKASFIAPARIVRIEFNDASAESLKLVKYGYESFEAAPSYTHSFNPSACKMTSGAL